MVYECIWMAKCRFSLAYSLGKFFRHTALPKSFRRWTMTTLREKAIELGEKVVKHARYRGS